MERKCLSKQSNLCRTSVLGYLVRCYLILCNALRIHIFIGYRNFFKQRLKKYFNLWCVSGSVTIESFQNVNYASEGVLFLVKLQTDIL